WEMALEHLDKRRRNIEWCAIHLFGQAKVADSLRDGVPGRGHVDFFRLHGVHFAPAALKMTMPAYDRFECLGVVRRMERDESHSVVMHAVYDALGGLIADSAVMDVSPP